MSCNTELELCSNCTRPKANHQQWLIAPYVCPIQLYSHLSKYVPMTNLEVVEYYESSTPL